jgi:GT2 family glycosyltransferase
VEANDIVVVVDNGSTDDTVALARRVAGVRLVANAENLGYSAGNNVGAHVLAAEGVGFLAFVNPDVEVEPTTLRALRSALREDDRAASAGGVMRRGDAPSAECFRRGFTLRAALTVYTKVRYLPGFRQLLAGAIARESARHYITPGHLASGDEVTAVSGGCVMFRTHAFFEAGTFDERSFLFCEEYMIADRLRALGYRVIAVPEAEYGHESGSSSSHVSDEFLWRHYLASERLYVREYLRWTWRARVLAFARIAERVLLSASRSLKRLRSVARRP